jgi:hypothetical protein
VQSPELPVAVLAVVGARVGPGRAAALRSGLLKLGRDPGKAELLASLRLRGFVPPELAGRTAAP